MALTPIDPYTDPSLPGANVYSATAGNVIVTYTTDKAIYVTEVTENVNQQFITNVNNVLTGEDYEIQFNIDDVLTGSPSLTFNPSVQLLTTSSLTATGTTNLGLLDNVKIYGGSSGQFPVTDGNGNLEWTTVTGTGSVTSVGVTSNNLTVTGSPITSAGTINIDMPTNITANSVRANSFIQGNATTTISTQTWFGAITFTGAANQVIYTTPVANIASIDFHVTATDGTSARQVSKILAVTQGATTNYTEYGLMFVGGQLAEYVVQQASGNINLTVSPTTANTVQYNIVLTTYNS